MNNTFLDIKILLSKNALLVSASSAMMVWLTDVEHIIRDNIGTVSLYLSAITVLITFLIKVKEGWKVFFKKKPIRLKNRKND